MPDIKILLVQLAVILVSCYVTGWLLSKFGQPQVVGEMVAGILLGPSLLGWLAPGLSAALFPQNSLPLLYALSQIGLLLFMFMIGLELDTKKLRQLGHVAVVISNTSMIVPFALGSFLAVYLYPRVADSSIPFTGFVLFMGAAMSVTAFPVLARILSERNLVRTKVGTLAIACAAVGDITAWIILAGIIAIVRSETNQLTLWQMLAGLLGYFALMLLGVRPLSKYLVQLLKIKRASNAVITALLLCMLLSSWTTDWLGIHALFGAFFAGVIMPKENGLAAEVKERLHPLVVILLLPLFFAFTGLRMNVAALGGASMLSYLVLILIVAVVGKFGGSLVAARVMGTSWRDSAAIGVLMNTRGLIELVILNIGLEIGVLSPSLFSMMVVMAVLTTLITTPLLSALYASPEPGVVLEVDENQVSP